MMQEEFTEEMGEELREFKEELTEEMRETMQRRREKWRAYDEALQRYKDHWEKVNIRVLETTDKIYDIIVENQLSIRNVKDILDDIMKRVERHSLVIVVDPVHPGRYSNFCFSDTDKP